ncbi:class I SAM-dependent methyltransferase [Halobacillus salinarum]|uniref:Class I SAM-dependent methyltransferase n=1 Tax=Halobacillus salinarum TaxID=2932257 RepID=A0ABY4EEC9_9BACI|nr:class I SAM-dependent methyltransferase [Halobacillus salinarum]UOQ42817.1 class I SAM-dependent methyltransferase [Halobacillus salinarum]
MENKYLDLLALFGIGGAHPGGLALTEDLLNEEKITPETYVLDIGCGTGQTAWHLFHTFGCRVAAVDQHPLMIEKTKKRFEDHLSRVDIIQGDAENLEFDSDLFDLVLSESVVSFTSIEKTIGELYRVLKPGGHLLMIEMTAENKLSDSEKQEVHDIYGVKQVFCENEWKDLLYEKGFTYIEAEDISLAHAAADQQDYSPSANIGVEHYDLWVKHAAFISSADVPIGCRVYRCYK